MVAALGGSVEGGAGRTGAYRPETLAARFGDAKVGGKSFGFAFNWGGDADAIESLMGFVEKMAADWKVTPDALTQSILRDLPTIGLLKDKTEQQFQMAAVLWTVLQLPTQNPDRPG